MITVVKYEQSYVVNFALNTVKLTWISNIFKSLFITSHCFYYLYNKQKSNIDKKVDRGFIYIMVKTTRTKLATRHVLSPTEYIMLYRFILYFSIFSGCNLYNYKYFFSYLFRLYTIVFKFCTVICYLYVFT